MKSKLYLGVALACSAAAAILPVHGYAAEAEGTAAAESKTAQETKAAPEAAPVALNTYAVDGVVVTASRMPQAITDVPANVSVITAQEIEDKHYNSLSEAISSVNGVVINRATSGEQETVMLNGDDRVLVLVDGKRINSDQGLASDRASADLRMIPPMSVIERIEVVKGGASSIYGSDAVGGVINVITKKGTKKIKTTIDAAYGSWHHGDYQITNQGSAKNLSWVVSGSIARRDYFKTKGYTGKGIKMPNSDTDEKNSSLRLDYQLNKRDSITLGYSHVNAKEGAYTSWDNGKTFLSNGYYKRVQNSVDLTWNFKEGTKAPGFVRVSHTNKENDYRDSANGGRFNYKTTAVEYQNGWELGKDHVLIAGIDWRHTTANSDGQAYKDKGITNTAFYVQDTWNIGKKWSVVPGLRIDHHSKYGTNWSPKVAINFTPDKKNQVYASWGKVFTAPMIDDLYTTGTWTVGNPNLKPEKGYNVTIGWNHEFDKKSSIGLSMFYSDIKDAIYWKEVIPHALWRSENAQKEKKRGIEINYKQVLDKHWAINTGMSFISRKYDDGTGMQKDLGYSSPNSYRLGINYKNRGWFVGVDTTIASGRNEATLGNRHYALLNLNASYQINDMFKIYLKALNLTNQYYSRGDIKYPGRGRFIQMGVQVSF